MYKFLCTVGQLVLPYLHTRASADQLKVRSAHLLALPVH